MKKMGGKKGLRGWVSSIRSRLERTRRLKKDAKTIGSAEWAVRLGGWFDDVSVFRALPDGKMRLKQLSIDVPGPIAEWVLGRNHNYPMMCELAENGASFEMEGERLVGLWHGMRFGLEPDTLLIFWELLVAQAYRWADFGRETLVFDIGANVGFASLAMAALHPQAEIHGFEAFRKTYQRALNNLDANPEIKGRIHLHCQALSDHNATETWKLGDNAGTSGQFAGDGNSVQVEVRKASDAMAAIANAYVGWPCVVKMDCEGGEYAILADWEASGFCKCIDLVVMEYHEIGGHKIVEIEAWCRRNGFAAVSKPQLQNGKKLHFGDMVLARVGLGDEHTVDVEQVSGAWHQGQCGNLVAIPCEKLLSSSRQDCYCNYST